MQAVRGLEHGSGSAGELVPGRPGIPVGVWGGSPGGRLLAGSGCSEQSVVVVPARAGRRELGGGHRRAGKSRFMQSKGGIAVGKDNIHRMGLGPRPCAQTVTRGNGFFGVGICQIRVLPASTELARLVGTGQNERHRPNSFCQAAQ